MDYNQLLEKLKQDLPSQTTLIPHAWYGWAIVAAFVIAAIWGMFALFQIYSVWAAHKDGQADLAMAHNEQQIQVAQAQGRLDAAQLNKQAEIIDAEAVAKSVDIIGKALHENTGYLQWKWIHMMEERDSSMFLLRQDCQFWKLVSV